MFPRSRSRISIPAVLSAFSLFISAGVLSLYLTHSGGFSSSDWRSALQHNAFELASRNMEQGRAPFKTMFGNNPNLIADVAEQVSPSVVNIDVERTENVPNIAMPFDQGMLERFFGIQPGDGGEGSPFAPFHPGYAKQIIAGNGSGVIVDSKGYILTNYHVVTSASKITVTLNDGRKCPGHVVGQDRFSDLAVVKIDCDNLQPAVLGDSQKLRPGEWVIAVGSPLGFDHTVTLGIISAISRRVPDINSNVDFIQTDAAINPGNSGGPLVNLRGEVVGINTAISARGQNIGFAVPVNVAKQVTDALIAHGKITRPWIGISMTDLTPELAKSLGLPTNTQGVVVAQVLPQSPSAQAGFRQGDILQRVDGMKIKSSKAVQEYVRQKPVNSNMAFQVLRDGQMMALQVHTAQLPNNPMPTEQQQPGPMGPDQ